MSNIYIYYLKYFKKCIQFTSIPLEIPHKGVVKFVRFKKVETKTLVSLKTNDMIFFISRTAVLIYISSIF